MAMSVKAVRYLFQRITMLRFCFAQASTRGRGSLLGTRMRWALPCIRSNFAGGRSASPITPVFLLPAARNYGKGAAFFTNEHRETRKSLTIPPPGTLRRKHRLKGQICSCNGSTLVYRTGVVSYYNGLNKSLLSFPRDSTM